MDMLAHSVRPGRETMRPMDRRKLKYFLRLNYPMHVYASDDGYVGLYPDLPGCEMRRDNLQDLKRDLERLRRAYLEERVCAGETPPLPNTHCS